MKRRLQAILLGAVSLHLLWVLLAWLIDNSALPYPWLVYQHLPSLLTGEMLAHLGLSALRVLLGILYSLLIAIPIALLLFSSHRIGRILETLIYLSYPIPKLALLPIVMLLFGLGESTKVIMIVLIILFQLVFGLRDSLRQIPRDKLALMSSLGANYWQCLRHVYLPAILPDLLSALRIALGTAISVLFVTETYGSTLGMGGYIVEAWMRVNYLDMYGGIMMLGLMGFSLFLIIDALEWLVCPWTRH